MQKTLLATRQVVMPASLTLPLQVQHVLAAQVTELARLLGPQAALDQVVAPMLLARGPGPPLGYAGSQNAVAGAFRGSETPPPMACSQDAGVGAFWGSGTPLPLAGSQNTGEGASGGGNGGPASLLIGAQVVLRTASGGSGTQRTGSGGMGEGAGQLMLPPHVSSALVPQAASLASLLPPGALSKVWW